LYGNKDDVVCSGLSCADKVDDDAAAADAPTVAWCVRSILPSGCWQNKRITLESCLMFFSQLMYGVHSFIQFQVNIFFNRTS
jgi:hypothetical protein